MEKLWLQEIHELSNGDSQAHKARYKVLLSLLRSVVPFTENNRKKKKREKEKKKREQKKKRGVI